MRNYPGIWRGLDILKGDAEIFKKALGVKCFDAYVAIAEV